VPGIQAALGGVCGAKKGGLALHFGVESAQCSQIPVTYNGGQANGYRLESVGTCGSSDLNSANPDFTVSRTLMVEAYDGGTP
jgi:hypothetical protein